MVALFHEACTDFLIVVDLAVEHQHQIAVLAVEWLCACLRHIDDAQPAVSQRNILVDVGALSVRPAVLDFVQHLLEHTVGIVDVIGKSYETTHGMTPF